MAFLIQKLVACFLILLCMNFIVPVTSIIMFNAIVSLDGSGDFISIGAAIAAAPNNCKSRFYIYVKPGIYREHVEVESYKTFIALIGDDAAITVIVDDRSKATGFAPSQSATFVVKGNNFMEQHITFQNSGGPENGQAVALLNNNIQAVYYECVFVGYQDTLGVNGKQLFFKDCEIYGTVDFIFGNGLAVFQDCKIYARLRPSNTITITAQSKKSINDNSGFSFQNCDVIPSPELNWSRKEEFNSFQVYLGRPWRDYSTVIFMNSFLDSMVNPAGWLEWSLERPLNLLFYAEFNNRGPGADVSRRVKWPGYHLINNSGEANDFTVRNFINGIEWLPETGVPFRPDL